MESSAAPAGPKPAEGSVSIGQRIGGYRVLRKLGEGGMGAVFEAVHEQIERRAAIKVLHARFSQEPEFAKRFFNEARAVNIVHHSGLVQIHEYGQLPDGTAYIVMEYLEGETMSARIKKQGGRLGLEGLNVIRQIASALAAAHVKGIVHRDLKPANIVIVPEPEAPGGERAKVLDFGVAKLTSDPPTSPDGGEGELRTKTGVFMGTPTYMAPEQCRGAGGVDDKADVYSLGAMLYQILAGRPPFVAPGEGEVMAMHIFATPKPVRDFDINIPPGLAELVHAMLSKKPEERPPMTRVAGDLGRWMMATGSMASLTASGIHLPTLSGGIGSGASPTPAGSQQSAPAVIVAEPPSVLGQAAGQADAPAQGRKKTRLVMLLLGPAAAAVAIVAALGLTRERPRPAPPEPAHALAPPQVEATQLKVRWTVASTPAGAQVVRLSDDKVLGETPFHQEQPAGTGTVAVVLRHPGFADRPLTLDLGSNESHSEKLDPLPQEAAAVTPEAAVRKPATPPAGAAGGKGPLIRKKPGTPPRPRPASSSKEMNDDDIPIIK